MQWIRKWQPTPVFLPGESQGWQSLVGCRLWGCTESDMTDVTQQQPQQGCRLNLCEAWMLERWAFPGLSLWPAGALGSSWSVFPLGAWVSWYLL